MSYWKNKTAIITGGGFSALADGRCGSIGYGIATAYAKEGANLVITGEGKVDFQTAKGKTAAGVLNRAKQQHIPVVAIGGCVEMCDSLVQMGFAGIYPILEEKVPLEIAMQRDFAMNNVRKTVARIVPNYLG
jgi:glycerate kinase